MMKARRGRTRSLINPHEIPQVGGRIERRADRTTVINSRTQVASGDVTEERVAGVSNRASSPESAEVGEVVDLQHESQRHRPERDPHASNVEGDEVSRKRRAVKVSHATRSLPHRVSLGMGAISGMTSPASPPTSEVSSAPFAVRSF